MRLSGLLLGSPMNRLKRMGHGISSVCTAWVNCAKKRSRLVKTESLRITISPKLPNQARLTVVFFACGAMAPNVARSSDRFLVFAIGGDMTIRTTDWLARTFRCLFDDSNRRSGGRRLRFAPQCREALESRDLLSDASGVWSFVSAPALHPMKVNVLNLQPGASLSSIFVSPYDQSSNPSLLVGQTGPLIMDSSGNPIWFHSVSSDNSQQVVDFQTQTLFGKPVLIWWQGTFVGPEPGKNLPLGTSLTGTFVIYNQHYQKIMSVRAPSGEGLDLHELQITPQGDAYFIITKTVKANLTSYGGLAKGEYNDNIIEEENLRTGKVIFTWNMAKHVPLSDSFTHAPTTPGEPWDAYHVNSIDVSPDGSQILISAPTLGEFMTSVTRQGRFSGRWGASRTSSISRPTWSLAHTARHSNTSTMRNSCLEGSASSTTAAWVRRLTAVRMAPRAA